MLLSNCASTIQTVRDFHQSLQTITVKSCAPAPLWKLLPYLISTFPSMTVSSSICDLEEIEQSIKNNSYNILILPYKLDAMPDKYQKFFMEEHLSVCVPPNHTLEKKASVTLQKLNGYNFLLRSELGFWESLCREKMPASKFLVQTDEFAFNELVSTSSLPCFVTDVVLDKYETPQKRVAIPITDPEVNVSFYVVMKEPEKYHFFNLYTFLFMYIIPNIQESILASTIICHSFDSLKTCFPFPLNTLYSFRTTVSSSSSLFLKHLNIRQVLSSYWIEKTFLLRFA